MLAGKRIYFYGKLSGLTRRRAAQFVREQGGIVASALDSDVDLIVVGEEELLAHEYSTWIEQFDDSVKAAYGNGDLEIQTESVFWANLSGAKTQNNLDSLFTIPMLAEFLELPIATIRLWYKRGLITPSAKVHELAYFDFQEILTAKALRDLLREGLSATILEKRLNKICGLFPDVRRPLAQLSAIVEGKDVLLRKENRLVDHKGQTRIDFDSLEFPDDGEHVPEEQAENVPDNLAFAEFEQAKPDLLNNHCPLQCLDFAMSPNGPSAQTLCEMALVLDSEGDLPGALATYRAALMAEGPNAETCFHVAGLLYRLGDLNGARERYYMALEIDEEYVEARANLGCLLVELEETELAVSAFQGALTHHPDYADVHYHLGILLWKHDCKEEALKHLRTFLRLQPDSPWAENVREITG